MIPTMPVLARISRRSQCDERGRSFIPLQILPPEASDPTLRDPPEHKTDHLDALPMGADPGKPLLQQWAALGKTLAVNA